MHRRRCDAGARKRASGTVRMPAWSSQAARAAWTSYAAARRVITASMKCDRCSVPDTRRELRLWLAVFTVIAALFVIFSREQHRIPIAEKTVALFNRVPVRETDSL